MIMEYTPHVIYGAMNTTIKQASMATQANAALATINMQRAGNADAILATGEQPGGVPMTIFPVQLSLTTLGCPFIRYSQELFVDFNTNTTADNLYYVNGIQHKLSPGEFTTTLKLTPCDAFPAYRNFVGQLNNASNRIKGITDGATAATAAAAATAATAAGAAAAAGGGGGGGGAHHGQGSRLGHSRAVLSHDPARAAQQQAVRDRLAEESRRAELTPDQRRAEDTRRAEDNQLAANYVMNGNILSNPEAVAARAQQTAAEARTRTAAATAAQRIASSAQASRRSTLRAASDNPRDCPDRAARMQKDLRRRRRRRRGCWPCWSPVVGRVRVAVAPHATARAALRVGAGSRVHGLAELAVARRRHRFVAAVASPSADALDAPAATGLQVL